MRLQTDKAGWGERTETPGLPDNHCNEWALPSLWVVHFVNVCFNQRENTTEVPAMCLTLLSEGRGISQTEEKLLPSSKAQHSSWRPAVCCSYHRSRRLHVVIQLQVDSLLSQR